jgi:hypothetical protein
MKPPWTAKPFTHVQPSKAACMLELPKNETVLNAKAI